MSNNYQQTWETYVAAWKAETENEKRALFGKSLASNCQYQDPLMTATGWDELVAYMQSFHQQIPGGHFVTKTFSCHNNKSIATWEMRNGDDVMLGDGISYGEYNEQGILVAMTGFFETPEG